MRQNGTALKRIGNNGSSSYALRPIINKGSKTTCWPTAEAYKEKAAELLKPHHNLLIELLQAFTIRIDAELQHINQHGSQGQRITAHLEIEGYCGMRSGALGGEVIWIVRDEDFKEQVPGGAVTYTLDELRVLVANPPADHEALKLLHEAKRHFNGEVMAL
jgi:hypothetical protein